MMTLDQAIKHCLEKTKDLMICEECRDEHVQLYTWLVELKLRREAEC